MTKKEFDKKYVGENIYILCSTEKLAKEFLKLADSFGYKWLDGDSFLDVDMWFVYEEKTCYNLSYHGLNVLEDCIENCWKIVEFK